MYIKPLNTNAMEKEEFKDKIQDAAEDAKEKITDFAQDAKEKIADFAEDAKDKIQDFTEDVKEKLDEAKCEADAQAGAVFDPEDIKKNKVMAVLAYIGILVIIPLICAKTSRFAKFHANQGIILLAAEVVAYLLHFIPVIRIIASIIYILVFIFSIIGIINAVKGEAKELPFIGHFRFIK